MKQVLQYRRSGTTSVVDVPAPLAPPDGALVRTAWSLISPGTERMLVEGSGANLLNTAVQRPDLVRQVVDKARRDGIVDTVQAVRSRLDVAIALGYSCAGTVVDLNGDVPGIGVGDRVACAGSGFANHAEFVGVPRNLLVRVPDAVSLEDAAFVTVGAIALHGVRIADSRVGDTCVVIGLGLVGQLTVQLLKAAGCRAFGVDVAEDRTELARSLGADGACLRSDPSLEQQIRDLTHGRGADAVLITAATSSSDPVELAPRVVRDRAVVVAVGMVGLNVPRNAYYEKELELRVSRSYGPGRYDRRYEQEGVDYPIGYVRWTEQRNMEAFLNLVAEGEGKVRPVRLVTHRFAIEDAERAYQVVTGATAEPSLGILLSYPAGDAAVVPSHRVSSPTALSAPVAGRRLRLGVVGAGSFARSVLLPELRRIGERVELRGVATASGPSAQQTMSRFGFGYASVDWRELVRDPDLDAVLVATRHDLHAEIAGEALRAGKSVLLEKPMALDDEQLSHLLATWEANPRVLQVGFNRRFSPTIRQLRAAYAGRREPLVLQYRVNAGAVAPGSWVVDPDQGGGRLVGEVCHMVDTLLFLTGAPVERVWAQPLPRPPRPTADDVALTLSFADGSIGTIVYAAGGDRGLPKERLEVFGGGVSAVLDDFLSLTVFDKGRARRPGRWRTQDKGHAAELAAFVDAALHGGPSPIHPLDAAHVTRVTFAATRSARSGEPIAIGR
jgi:predicted dehydrogenase/threonine dehydrogenase-like Zn-dependent dehydrogenase